MSVNLMPSISTVGIIFACLLLPPIFGAVTEGLRRSFAAKAPERSLPMILQLFRNFVPYLTKYPLTGSAEQSVLLSLHLVFNILALLMLILQTNLLPAFFVQAFSAIALILAQMQINTPLAEQKTNHAFKIFLIEQPLLFVVAVGVFFATGTFKMVDALAHPKLLLVDLPLLLAALLVILYSFGKRESVADNFNGPLRALVELAKCYRNAFLLLFAGMFFAHTLVIAVSAAVIICLLLAMSEYIRIRDEWRFNFVWSWGYVFFACGLNLTWVYLKYWL